MEYLQCETQAVIEGDALIFCEGTDSGPYLVPHVAEVSLHFPKEGSQSPVVVELVVVHHFVHLFPCGIHLGAEAAGRGLMFCFHDVIPQNSRVGSLSGRMPQGQCFMCCPLD